LEWYGHAAEQWWTMQQLCRAVAASANHSRVTGAKHSTLTEQ